MAELVSLLLSIAGGIDVTARASSEIARLVHDWKDAPALVISLNEEVHTSRQTTLQLKSFCENLDERTDGLYISSISRQVLRAEPYWWKLEEILRSLRDPAGRIRKERWIKCKRKVTSLQGKLRELRLGTLEILSIYTASRTTRIGSALAIHHEVQRAWIESTTRSILDTLQKVEDETPSKTENVADDGSDERRRLFKDSTSKAIESAWAVMPHLNGQGVQCNSRCPCRCHSKKQRSQFRVNLFNGILGSLLIVYSGWNFTGPRCDLLSCHGSRFKLLEVSYYTSLQPRSVSIVASLKLLDGEPSISFTVGRTVHIVDFRDPFGIHVLSTSRTASEMKHRLESRPGAILEVSCVDGCSALHFAAMNGGLDMIETLLAAGADPFFENYWGVPAAVELFQRILQERDSPQERDRLKELVPMSACLDEYNFSHIEKVVLGFRPLRLQVELDKAVYRNELYARDGMGMTPLHWAAIKKDAFAVSTLLRAGAYVDTPDRRGKSALYHACQSNWKNGVTKLIAFGAGIDTQTQMGYTPMHAAAAGNATRGLLSLLVSAGADLDESRNVSCSAPLNLAALYYSTSCCNHLLDLGANIEKMDRDGHTPLFTSLVGNAHACIQLFLLRGANFVHKDNEQRTLFHVAAIHGNGRTFEILINAILRGLKANAKDSKSMTAQQYFTARTGVPRETVERFETLLEKLKRENMDVEYDFETDSSDNDVFFDASETVEA